MDKSTRYAKIQIYNPKDATVPQQEIQVKNWKSIGSTQIPSSIEYTSRRGADIDQQIEYSLDTIEITSIDESNFVITLPDKTRITDFRNGTKFRVGEDPDHIIEEIKTIDASSHNNTN